MLAKRETNLFWLRLNANGGIQREVPKEKGAFTGAKFLKERKKGAYSQEEFL